MKKTSLVFLVLIFSISLFGQGNDTSLLQNQYKTRKYTLDQAFKTDSVKTIKESPLLKAFESIGWEPVSEAYKLNRLSVDSLLVADSLNPNFWRVYGYQAVHIFVQANKSPSMAMAIYLPIFLICALIIIIISTVKTFFVRPQLSDAQKPSNDPNALNNTTTEEDLEEEDVEDEEGEGENIEEEDLEDEESDDNENIKESL